MKKRNGFTLIELLAIIVILAVIALIAVPQILKILNKARLSAAEDSTYGIVKAAETYTTNFMLKNNGSLPNVDLVFNCDSNGCSLNTTLTGYDLTNLDKLDFKGTKPKSGKITISNNGINIVATDLIINGFNCNYPIDSRTTCIKTDDIKNNEYVKNNLLVRYNYEDGSNTSSVLKDLSGNGYDGMVNGATFTNDGLLFDGVDDYVSIAEINTPNFTWEVSFKANQNSSWENIIGNQDAGGCGIFYYAKESGIQCYIKNIGYRSTSKGNFEFGQIYTVTGTYDGNILRFYKDGMLIGENANSNGLQYTKNNTIIMLGANPSWNKPESSFFNGTIYSVRLYDRALSEAEIKYNYLIDSSRYKS